MKFVVKKQVDWVNIIPYMKSKDEDGFANYILRSIGFSRYIHELSSLVINDKFMEHIKKFEFIVEGSIRGLYIPVSTYYDALYHEMGFDAEEASVQTWNVFEEIVEKFIMIMYDLYEIEHFSKLLTNVELKV